MPAIRDSSFAYESVTTDAGLTIPMCAYAEGDLLIAVGTADTGTPTWGCSNGVGSWNQLFQRSDTSHTTVFWKYAAASGEGDVVLTSTVNETYSGILISIRDVYQSYTGGSPMVYSAAASSGTQIALPTITTSSDNSLVLAIIGSSPTAPSIHFVNSALQEIVKVDGTAEGIGAGWFFKKSAGVTTAHNAGVMTNAAGSKAVIEIRAPAGGATVIPTYPVEDDSLYITPSFGIAYDSNTAIAATADTNFGTSLNGITAVDATVATAVTDIGIDKGSFMSFAGITNTASATAIAGAEGVVAASRYNVGNRNILTHLRHSTPVQNQRLSTLTSGRGVWFGIKSGATAGVNFKIWQVHGSDVPVPPGSTVTIVVNAANTDSIVTNGTLSNSDVRRYGMWTAGVGVLTQQACFGPAWAMGTTTIAGGNSSEPVTISSIVSAAAAYKNRRSSILQGASQMLCLQKIQFGNGGTNPIYLNLNSTAIEFPSRKNISKKIVNYNGIDNEVGLEYYAGASDTIIHSSSSIVSTNRYYWKINASSSASASYNFAGLSLIGAGDIQLRDVTTFSDMTFSKCGAVVQNSAYINNCSFNSTIDSAALTSNNPGRVSDCTFVSSGTGHAIEITAPGTYTLSGNTFTGYAGSGGTSTDRAVYNNSGGSITLNVVGGAAPSIRNGAGATTTVVLSTTLELTGLKNPTEVRVFDAGTTTAIAGTENVTSGTFSASIDATAYSNVDISIISLGYQNIRLLSIDVTSDISIPVQQAIDRQYANP